MKKIFGLLMFVLLFGTICVSADNQYGDFLYTTYEENEIMITGYTNGEITDVVIPETIDGKVVTAVSGDAFYKNEMITSVTFPKGGENGFHLGANAFVACRNLESVTYLGDAGFLEGGCFAECSSLKSVTFSGVITARLEDYAFSYCTALEEITIPDVVGGIYRAFYGCTNLSSVTIGTTPFLEGTFEGCTSLSNVIIESTERIGVYTFFGCQLLEKLELPDTVTEIGEYAFYDSGIMYLTLPGGLKTIGTYAFGNCNATLTVPESVESMGEQCFNNVPLVYAPIRLQSDVWGAREIRYTDYIKFFWNDEELETKKVVIDQGFSIPDMPDLAEGYEYVYYYNNEDVTEYIVEEKDDCRYHAVYGADRFDIYTRPKSYDIIFTGDYNDLISATHGSDVTLPQCSNKMYEYIFYYNNERWYGENVTSNMEINVVKKIKTFTVEFVGDYTDVVTVVYNDSVDMPVCSDEGYYYLCFVDGGKYSGELTYIQRDYVINVIKKRITYTVCLGDTIMFIVNYGESFTLPSHPTEGWRYIYSYLTDELRVYYYNEGDVIENIRSNITLSVTEKIKSYEVFVHNDDNGEEGTYIVNHGENLVDYFPPCEKGHYYKLQIPNETNDAYVDWDGYVYGEMPLVIKKSVIYTYTVTYTGDYTDSFTVNYGEDVTLPVADEGYHYVAVIDGKEFESLPYVTSDINAVLKKCINVYTVQFYGVRTDSVEVEHGKNAILPVCEDPDDSGIYYKFWLNGEYVTEINNVTSNLTVDVTYDYKEYTVIYEGDCTYTEKTVEHGDIIRLPNAPTGYEYIWDLNGEAVTETEYTVKSDMTFTATKQKLKYTVTFTGAYEKQAEVEYQGRVALPENPENCRYVYTVANGQTWSNYVVADITVTVTLKSEDYNIYAIAGMDNLSVNGDTVTANVYINYLALAAKINENSSVAFYSDSTCLYRITNLNVSDGNNIFYAKVTTEFGDKIYTVNAVRELPENLGSITIESTTGNSVTMSLANDIAGVSLEYGRPDITIQYYYEDKANFSAIWVDLDTVYSLVNGKYLYAASGLTEATQYSLRITADYGDRILYCIDSVIVETDDVMSDECEILKVESPNELTVPSGVTEITIVVMNKVWDDALIDVVVSQNASWALYSSSIFAQNQVGENTSKRMDLEVGNNTAYIRVTAENGYSYKIYKLTIYRQSISDKPVITYNNGYVTITAENCENIIYTIDGTEPSQPPLFNGIYYTQTFSAQEGMLIKAIAKSADKDEYSEVQSYTVVKQSNAVVENIKFKPSDDGYSYEFALITDGFDGVFYIALYNEGRLISSKTEAVDGSAGYATITGNISSSTADEYRAYFLKDMLSVSPLADICKGDL